MKILGIDYGRSKIGIALGNTETELVEPIGTIRIKNKELRIKDLGLRIGELREIKEIKKIVVGLPGGKWDKEVKKFGGKLARKLELPVEFFDETLTTKDAQRVLIETKGNRKKRKTKEDAIAAAIMLESYMEGRLC